METHSKSWRGPREFFREILIIVVGVLIALSGQQAVDWIHQQNELAETREALRDEIAQNASLVALGSALDRCRFAMTEKFPVVGPADNSGDSYVVGISHRF